MGYLESITTKAFGIFSHGSDQISPRLSPRKPSSPFSTVSLRSSRATSSASSSGSSFWMPHGTSASRAIPRLLPSYLRTCITKRQLAVLMCLFLTAFVWFSPAPPALHHATIASVDQLQLHPYIIPDKNKRVDEKNPMMWLEKNSKNKHAIIEQSHLSSFVQMVTASRPRGALISLVRNAELVGISQSMRQLEHQWNRKYQYPWIFFNDEPFSDEFKARRASLPCKHSG
jgi:alpha 1,2-mannosyltransferase